MEHSSVKKILSLFLALTMLVSCFVLSGITASAAYVTDGDALYEAGDVNSDGTVDILDLVGATIGSGNTTAADLDGTGSVEAYDYALIRAMILGIDESKWTD